MAQRNHLEFQCHLHRLLEAGPEEIPLVLAKIAQYPEVRAPLARDVHEPQVLVATLLDLPRTDYAVTVGINQNRDDLPRRIGMLTPAAVLGVHRRGVELPEQISINETIVIVRQQIENVAREQLVLEVIRRVILDGSRHPTLSSARIKR